MLLENDQDNTILLQLWKNKLSKHIKVQPWLHSLLGRETGVWEILLTISSTPDITSGVAIPSSHGKWECPFSHTMAMCVFTNHHCYMKSCCIWSIHTSADMRFSDISYFFKFSIPVYYGTILQEIFANSRHSKTPCITITLYKSLCTTHTLLTTVHLHFTRPTNISAVNNAEQISIFYEHTCNRQDVYHPLACFYSIPLSSISKWITVYYPATLFQYEIWGSRFAWNTCNDLPYMVL
jgi:hypothetical protein